MAALLHPSFMQETDMDLSSIDPFLLGQDQLKSRKSPMVDNNLFNIPLSPPTSPRLSAFQAEHQDNTWPEQQAKAEAAQEHSDGNMALVHTEIPSLTLDTKP